jgi:putative phosphoribosyl transferase
MTFASRQDAGYQLGRHLREGALQVDVVMGLPRGGVIVAAEVARVLHRPLDVLVVRKIGHPLHREFAVGALAEADVVVLDPAMNRKDPRIQNDLERIIAEEARRLHEYEIRFHHGRRLQLADRDVLLVDDGLATGATTEAAVLSARKQNARSVVVAAPVASINACERLEHVADQVIALDVDPEFDAVGRYYEEFSQTSDEEVIELLEGERET